MVVPVEVPFTPEEVPIIVVGSIKQFVPVKSSIQESLTIQLSKLELITVEVDTVESFMDELVTVELLIVVTPVREAIAPEVVA